MNRSIPGILYIHFYEDDLYQLWALPIAPGKAADIQEAYNDDEWPQSISEEIEEEYGTMDFASSPCDEVHGMGFCTSEVSFEQAPSVMNAWRQGLIEGTGSEEGIGEPVMIQGGTVDDESELSTDADVHALCVAA